MTQKEMVKYHIETHGSITPKEAIDLYGIMRLGARIWDLKADGVPIETAMRQVKNRWGKKTFVAEYRLKREAEK